MMQEHSNRPQCFKMKGETVIVCESVNKKFLTLSEQGKYIAPFKFVGNKDDFTSAIKSYLQSKYNQYLDKFETIGFIKMESQIKEDTYEQYIRNVFYLRFYGDDNLIPDFKTADEISKNSTDKQFLGYLSYIQNGGIAYPLQLFVQEGSTVELPQYTTPFQKEKMKQFIQQQNANQTKAK